MSTKRDIPNLDWIRGLAIIAIVLFHYTNGSGSTFGYIRDIMRYGYTGVICFFMISGIVIPYSMYQNHYTVKTGFIRFMTKRFIRLYPPILVSLVFSVSVTMLNKIFLHADFGISWLNLFGNLFFAEGIHYINPVFWFVVAIVQFYILFSLLFPLMVNEKNCSGIVLYNILTISIISVKYWGGGYPMVMKGIPYLLTGFMIFRYKIGLSTLRELLVFYIVAVCGVILTCPIENVLVFFLTGVAILGKRISIPPLEFVGRMSYSWMLLHGPIGSLIIFTYTFLGTNHSVKVLMIIFGLISGAILSYFMWKLIEIRLTSFLLKLCKKN